MSIFHALHLLHFLSHNKLKVTLQGSQERSVWCEHCGSHFEYTLTRSGTGYADVFFSWNSAQRRAWKQAFRACQKAVLKGIDLVPCPHCQKFQRKMVNHGRRKRFLWCSALTPIAFLAGAIATASAHDAGWGMLPAAAACPLLGLAWAGLYNPNWRPRP